MDRLGQSKPFGLNGAMLHTWGTLFLAAGVVSRGILQGQLLQIGQVTAEQLLQAMQGSKTVMLYVTLALALQAIETCAVPIFAFLLVEGAQHTASFRNYFLRVAGLAVLCEIPYNLALTGRVLDMSARNPVFGAVLGLALLYFYRRFSDNTVTAWTVRAVATAAALLWCSMLSVQNGGGMVLLTAVLWAFRSKPLLRSLVGAAAVLLCCLGSMFYMAAPMAFLAVHFYNGEKGEQSRWANYLAYPALLVAAAAVRLVF